MASAQIYFFSFILLSTFLSVINGEESDWFYETKLFHQTAEKITHLHFYFHDIQSGKKPSAIQVAGPKVVNFVFAFGAIMVADEPLTEGPEPTSKQIGKAQGMFASAGQEELGFLMVFSFVFQEGKYNGSTLSVLGRNAVQPVKEMPIVGGTGIFRFARGHAQATTFSYNSTTGDVIVEYNLAVVHH